LVRADGLLVTNAARTVLDLFAVLQQRAAELALEDALRKKVTTIDRLWGEYAIVCKPGRNGCRAFRNALLRRDYRDGTLESRMEAKMHSIAKRLLDPAPTPQFPVATPQRTYRIDFAFPDIKLGIETQSIRWHLGEVKWQQDLARDRALKRLGWALIYYTWDDILHPATVVEEITAIRGQMENRLPLLPSAPTS
jgi:very-short-patch-repair endonuclease